MNSFLCKTALFLLLITYLAEGYAQDKIAILDLQRVFDESKVADQEREKLKENTDYKALLDQAKKLDTESKALADELEKNNLTWSDKKKQEQAGVIQKKQQELNYLLNQRSAFLNQLSNKIKKQVTPQLKSIVEKITVEKGINVILSAEATYFYDESLDITLEVLTELNK